MVRNFPILYNYVHILVKSVMNVCIRGRNDIIEGKRSVMNLNTVTSQQFGIILESVINHGVFRSNGIEIGVEFVYRLYEYCTEMKKIPY